MFDSAERENEKEDEAESQERLKASRPSSALERQFRKVVLVQSHSPAPDLGKSLFRKARIA